MKFECYHVVYLVLLDVSHKFCVWPGGGADEKNKSRLERLQCLYEITGVYPPPGFLTILFTPIIFINRDIVFTKR